MRERWADAGNIGIPTSEKIEEGWVEEIPPSEIANFIENRQDEALAYLMQQGVAEWESGIEYQPSSFIQYNGKIYKATGVNIGQQPNISPASWTQAFDDFGSAADVQMELDALIVDPNPFEQYILAENGSGTGTHTFEQIDSVSVNVEQGTPSAGNPKGFTFGDLKTTGFYQDTTSGRVAYQQAGAVMGLMPDVTSIPTATSDKTLVTAEWVKGIIAQSIYPVDSLYITMANANPATILGFGTWQRFGEGRTLASFSSDVTSATPDWLKVAGNTFGSYTETITQDQIPPHFHTTVGDDELRVGSRFGSDGLIPNSDVLYPYDSVSNSTPAAGREFRTGVTGTGLPHNNVQPSIVVFIWRRVT
jgi:hypothetical protein